MTTTERKASLQEASKVLKRRIRREGGKLKCR